ncbi:MAG: helix-turn-helix domain-containing protein [Lachnospiraceae bacterium]|nr:helix-turn-helix domain-containing protein [Lachnospiraceae bacterium]
MSIDYDKLGMRISSFRNKKGFTQDELAEKSGFTRQYISKIEIGKPLGLDALISIANALGVSPDDLLVDSLEYPASTADSELHRLLLDCNKIEEEILTRTVKELKAILYGLGI